MGRSNETFSHSGRRSFGNVIARRHRIAGTRARAWLILQRGATNNRAVKRANVAHALRLLVHNQTAQQMAERALADPDPKVRAAAARALGPMRAVSSVPTLKGLLADKEPLVVLAAAHSLYLLGDRDEVYDIDYEVLNGKRKVRTGSYNRR
jgi:HEAT repeat protein